MTANSSGISTNPLRPSVSRRVAVGHGALAFTLLGRAAINATFAFWLWSARPGWSQFFDGAATYLAADGIFALLASTVLAFGVLAEAPRLLIAATTADGVLRIVAAIVLWAFPGLPDFPVTAVAFFGVAGGCAGCLSVAAIIMRVGVWRSRHHAHERTPLFLHEELDPAVVAGLIALAFVGYALVVGPPVTASDYRAFGIAWAAIAAAAFALAALGVTRDRRPTS